MKLICFTAAFLLLAALSAAGQQQKKTITGKVISFNESFPLKGVLVRVKDTNISTLTTDNGTFTLEISEENQSLTFSLGGYKTKEVRISKSLRYDVVLEKGGGAQDGVAGRTIPRLAVLY